MGTQSQQESPASQPSLEEIGRAAGYLRDANQLLAQRFSYSLVAHSMALTAYATSIASIDYQLVALIVALFGLYFARIQFTITYRLSKKIDALREEYLERDPVYLVYKLAKGGSRRREIQTVEVPLMLGVMWISLIMYVSWPFLANAARLTCSMSLGLSDYLT